MNNGGCDTNAFCSHENKTFSVVCTCKTGYTNVGTAPSVVCTGQIMIIPLRHQHIACRLCTDSCLVKNGGCDGNATCSHNTTTNAVVCTCKTGYTNTGSDSKVICTGNTSCILLRAAIGPSSSLRLILDSCEVKNGHCDPNAVCSHESVSNAVTCNCKTGYVNVGSSSSVICKGETTVELIALRLTHHVLCRYMSGQQWWM